MAEENRSWTRQSEAFWRAHHEVWKRSDRVPRSCGRLDPRVSRYAQLG